MRGENISETGPCCQNVRGEKNATIFSDDGNRAPISAVHIDDKGIQEIDHDHPTGRADTAIVTMRDFVTSDEAFYHLQYYEIRMT